MVYLFVIGIALFLIGMFCSAVLIIRLSEKWFEENRLGKNGIVFFGLLTAISMVAAAVLINLGMNATSFGDIPPPQGSGSSDDGMLASWVQVVPKDFHLRGRWGFSDASTKPSAGSCAPVFSIRAVVMSGQECPEPPTIDDMRVAQPWQTRKPDTTGRSAKFAQILCL